MKYVTIKDIKKSLENILVEKYIRYEISESSNILYARIHLEDTDEYTMYEDLSIILSCNDTITICMLCNNISKLNELYAFNPQIGYSIFECANSFALVKLVRVTNKIQLEVTLLPFQCEDSDKIIKISIKQLLFALDKLKKLEDEMRDKYEKSTEDKKQHLVIEAVSKRILNQ